MDQAIRNTKRPPIAPPNWSAESARAALLEPLNEGHAHEKVAEHARAERDDHERRVEAGQRIDLAQEHETEAESKNAGADDALRPEAVDRPSEQRAEQRGLGRLQRGCAG